MNDNTPLAQDVLRGADDIAAFLGMEPRAIYHAASRSKLPTFRLGAKICARKSTLLTWIAEQEKKGRAVA
ncbi:DNA-binding protein [Roseixanthobacter pseudopolyaromaticivorans]|uniref:DNA-binding protein n=1 Tax=Xanthobacteraceae TaxID=335928 RepID=UPI00372766CA